jgi:hypothetical protein
MLVLFNCPPVQWPFRILGGAIKKPRHRAVGSKAVAHIHPLRLSENYAWILESGQFLASLHHPYLPRAGDDHELTHLLSFHVLMGYWKHLITAVLLRAV